MQELKTGDLIISNDLMGFVKQVGETTLLVNTQVGERTLSKNKNIVVMITAEELALRYASKLQEALAK